MKFGFLMYKIDNKNQKAKIKNLEQRLDFQKYNIKEKKQKEKRKKKERKKERKKPQELLKNKQTNKQQKKNQQPSKDYIWCLP